MSGGVGHPQRAVQARTAREFPISIPVSGSPDTLYNLMKNGNSNYDPSLHDQWLMGGKVVQYASTFKAGRDTATRYIVDPTKIVEYSENILNFLQDTYVQSNNGVAVAAVLVVYFLNVPQKIGTT